ncbi:hypothetical protein [Desulfocurvus sp. DL9XJH121]
MPKRQLILLILMGLTVAFAAADLLFGDAPAPPAEARQEDLDKLVKQVDTLLAAQKLTDVEAYRISLLGGPDAGDPLVKLGPADQADKDVASRTGDDRFTYTAFMRFGDQAMAVINDEECAPGDPVADTGYTLLGVTREAATIQGNNPTSGTLEKIVIPIREDIITFPEEGGRTAEDADARK